MKFRSLYTNQHYLEFHDDFKLEPVILDDAMCTIHKACSNLYRQKLHRLKFT